MALLFGAFDNFVSNSLNRVSPSTSYVGGMDEFAELESTGTVNPHINTSKAAGSRRHSWAFASFLNRVVEDPTESPPTDTSTEGGRIFGPGRPPSSNSHPQTHKRFLRRANSVDVANVSEILSTMKESSNNCNGTTGPIRSSSSPKVSDLVSFSSESISFEVLYMGKLRMSYRKAPCSFIDEALDKFKSHENERETKERRDSVTDSRRSSSQDSCSELGSVESLSRRKPVKDLGNGGGEFAEGVAGRSDGMDTGSLSDVSISLSENKENRVEDPSAAISHPLEDLHVSGVQQPPLRNRNPSGDSWLVKSLSLPAEPMRNRALSTGHTPRRLETTKVSSLHYNRTMLLLVGRTELRIISPDAKTTLFNKQFRDVYQLSQGMQTPECFGFICREGSTDNNSSYVAYVFRCQSATVAGEILTVLKTAHASSQDALKKERHIQSCDHCPMMWYSRLCNEVEGLLCDERIQSTIMKRVENLPEDDRKNILAKFHGADPQGVPEQNELLMMLLRAHCESKQSKHIHDTAAQRHEFLNQYLGLGSSVPMLMKAKRSIANSFDKFKFRVKDGNQLNGPNREFNLPQYVIHQGKEMSPSSGRNSPAGDQFLQSMVVSDSPLEKNNTNFRPRSSTVGALTGEKIRCELRNRKTFQEESGGLNSKNVPVTPSSQNSQSKPSHMMNIFLKVGSQKPSTPPGNCQQVRRGGSWRHAMFKRVVSPSTPQSNRGSPNVYSNSSPVSSRVGQFITKKTPQQIRELWRTAIKQQILLIRMEKQNLTLKEKQQEANVKRSKLSYRELGVCDEEANDTWDLIISQANSSSNKVDVQLLNSALLRGIPKHKRGQVWQLFIQQRNLGKEETSPQLPNQNTHYEELLTHLTSQQHAILIDLGRTFPSHPYFSSPLGSGQLALFNLLKAYSLLDSYVNYCQGLSFVAGLLLMHLEEEEAFNVLKYIMIDLGAREHYKPDMLGLQVKLYQLTRLIHDQDSDIHLLLYHNDVLPSLYAAPWFLTMFASQFPVGFAVRVLDVVMLHGVDIMAKFALAIILDHKKELMECTGLEQIMECFKSVVTHVNSAKLDRYLKRVIEMESEKQMLTYAVEYSVMNDETFHAFLNDAAYPPVPDVTKKPEKDVLSISPGGGDREYKDIIRSQDTRISSLEMKNAELTKDMETLLRIVLNGGGGVIPKGSSSPYSPEITHLAHKYLNGNHVGDLLGNGDSVRGRGLGYTTNGELPLGSCDRHPCESSPLFRSVSRESSVEDSSSHGIPALDPDSDDSEHVVGVGILKNLSTESMPSNLNNNNIACNGSDVIFTSAKSDSHPPTDLAHI